jgi:precorrin-6x reductase
VSPLPVAVSIYRSGEVYGITTCKDGGSNLPTMASPWQRQTETLLVEGTHPFGVDASQAIRDIARHGYHLITVQEMLRRSI